MVTMVSTTNTTLTALQARLSDIDAMGSALGLLGWDLETMMPEGASDDRAQVSATLSRMAHELFVAPEVGDWLQTLLPLANTSNAESPNQEALNPEDAAMVRMTWRAYQRQINLPTALVEALERASSKALPVWAEARKQGDFSAFAPLLNTIVDLNREKAQCLSTSSTKHPYDALLEGFEPDMTVAQLDPLFNTLQATLTPMVQTLSQQAPPALPQGSYTQAAQWQFSQQVLTAMGFDMAHGRLDVSVHPFTCGISPHDVRLTTRVDEQDPLSCLYSVLHEGGHGLYEQGQRPSLWGKGLFGGASLGIHESQSRLWENLVGRSRAFWQAFYPAFQSTFAPVLDGTDLEACYQAVNRVQPSAIRVEADEVTYNLHILLRYQLEKALLTGELNVTDLPQAWNDGMTRLLGYTPKNDAEGCLQDVHWAHGTLGYFPTYTLGNIYASMFWQQAEKAGVTSGIAQGNLHPLRDWLKANIHDVGSSETPTQIVQRVTGQTITVEPFIAYLKSKWAI
jgi:carboxypeptidase Taq